MSGGQILDVDLRVHGDALAEARRKVGDLAADLPRDVREDLQLLVSELVANSLRHAGLCEADWIRLKALVGQETVRVEVSDPGKVYGPADGEGGIPPPRSGLWMLNAIADRWGVVRDGTTRVWFEADLPAGETQATWMEAVGAWPLQPRMAAFAVARLYGPPSRIETESLIWSLGESAELTVVAH